MNHLEMDDDPLIDKEGMMYFGTKRMIYVWLFVLIFDFFLFPIPVLAERQQNTELRAEVMSSKDIREYHKKELGSLPPSDDVDVSYSGHFVVTAYTSEVAQTDSTPCITANGFNVCEHGIEDTVATNYLPFGTRIKIPELFGERVFIVRDRMNARYYRKFDVWMKDKQDAIDFGVRVAKIQVLNH